MQDSPSLCTRLKIDGENLFILILRHCFTMKLRWGICGSGLIANDFLVGLSTLPPEDHSVVAIAETWTPEMAQELAKKFHIDAVYEKFTDVAEDPNIGKYHWIILSKFN